MKIEVINAYSNNRLKSKIEDFLTNHKNINIISTNMCYDNHTLMIIYTIIYEDKNVH